MFKVGDRVKLLYVGSCEGHLATVREVESVGSIEVHTHVICDCGRFSKWGLESSLRLVKPSDEAPEDLQPLIQKWEAFFNV